MPRWLVLGLLGLAVGLGGSAAARADEPDARGLELFEKKIRPVLVEHCYQCHSVEAEKSKKLRGGLLLDSKAGVLKGGDSGPVLVPGKAAQSLLIKGLRYSDDLRMPPKQKLPEPVIADFEAWVNLGAPDPRTVQPTVKKQVGLTIEEGRKFWAYRPPVKPSVPAVRDAAWPVSAIDRFLLAGLEAKGLRPAAEADRQTLVRRVYFDLIGLPPTIEEMERALGDKSQDWFERMVEQLLSSPHFGERWGRHWLDVARFAESLTLRGFILKESWRYRDYVIDALNDDMPFDRFIREQIAGDLLPGATPADRRRQLIATTFLTLGNSNLEEQDKRQLRMDVVDEQLETIGRAFLAQTIGCARCHDHKFDPIPTRDYYSLAGILRNTKTLEHANVSRWLEMPLPADAEQEAVFHKNEKAIADLQARIKGERARLGPQPVASARKGPVAVKDLAGVVVDDTQAKKVGEWVVSQAVAPYVGSGYVHDGDTRKAEKTITFQPELPASGKYEVRFAYTAGANRAAEVPVTVFSADGEKTIPVNQKLTPPIDGLFLSLGQYNFEKNGQSFVIVSNEGTKGHVIADAVVFIPVEQLEGAAKPKPAAGEPKPAPGGVETLRKLEEELKRLQASGPKREQVMTVVEEREIGDTQVHIRGSVHNLGEKAPRGFLQVANLGANASFSTRESGRRQLADWIADRENPLTARVIVNRAWHWLFGSGLVRTTDNFGTTGETPSHPELLDYLAVRFVEEGWSLKKLVRALVLTRAYRLKVDGDPGLVKADPENRLFGRRNRRRLEAECIRDTMLSVSGQLQLQRGGPTYAPSLSADYGYRHTDNRRSVYSPVFRNSLPELFEVFDFADPSVSTGRRNVSTVAPQALFLMNHPFVVEQARHAARRLLADKALDDAGRVARAYRLALGRPPSAAESRVALEFLTARPGNPQETWAVLCQALFASLDFRYVN